MADTAIAVRPPDVIDVVDLAVHRAPAEVIKEAQLAAAVLKDVLDKKPKKICFNGRQYLEFEDWQTVGRFYGVTARVRESKYVEYGDDKGFEAFAEAVMVSTGQVVSSADAMCLDNEKTWKGKPLNQIRSMAQTRACAKALRNVLSWVVVLAGYAPTPAEERDPEAEHEEREKVKEQRIEHSAGGLLDAEIRPYIEGLAKGKVDPCFDYIQNQAIAAGGQDAENMFLTRLKDFGARIGPQPTIAQLKGQALIEWGEVIRLRKIKAQREKDAADSAFGVAK